MSIGEKYLKSWTRKEENAKRKRRKEAGKRYK
jgi:hypothetical protein